MYDVDDTKIRYELVRQPAGRCRQSRRRPRKNRCPLCRSKMPWRGQHLCIVRWAVTGEWHPGQGYAPLHQIQ